MIKCLIISLLSSIPFVDINITKFIYNIKYTHNLSKFVSKYIIYFNIIVNLVYLNYTRNYKEVFIRYFTELIVVNFVFKWVLDRKRPIHSLVNNKYNSVYEIKFSKIWTENQSFPSGHVCTIYSTYKILCNTNYFMKLSKIYYFLIYLTIYARINLAEHHFSDCIFAILITKLSRFLLERIIY